LFYTDIYMYLFYLATWLYSRLKREFPQIYLDQIVLPNEDIQQVKIINILSIFECIPQRYQVHIIIQHLNFQLLMIYQL
jgi:hypothetical protein